MVKSMSATNGAQVSTGDASTDASETAQVQKDQGNVSVRDAKLNSDSEDDSHNSHSSPGNAIHQKLEEKYKDDHDADPEDDPKDDASLEEEVESLIKGVLQQTTQSGAQTCANTRLGDLHGTNNINDPAEIQAEQQKSQEIEQAEARFKKFTDVCLLCAKAVHTYIDNQFESTILEKNELVDVIATKLTQMSVEFISNDLQFKRTNETTEQQPNHDNVFQCYQANLQGKLIRLLMLEIAQRIVKRNQLNESRKRKWTILLIDVYRKFHQIFRQLRKLGRINEQFKNPKGSNHAKESKNPARGLNIPTNKSRKSSNVLRLKPRKTCKLFGYLREKRRRPLVSFMNFPTSTSSHANEMSDSHGHVNGHGPCQGPYHDSNRYFGCTDASHIGVTGCTTHPIVGNPGESFMHLTRPAPIKPQVREFLKPTCFVEYLNVDGYWQIAQVHSVAETAEKVVIKFTKYRLELCGWLQQYQGEASVELHIHSARLARFGTHFNNLSGYIKESNLQLLNEMYFDDYGGYPCHRFLFKSKSWSLSESIKTGALQMAKHLQLILLVVILFLLFSRF